MDVWSGKIPHAAVQLTLCTTVEPVSCSYWSPCALEPALHNEKAPQGEVRATNSTCSPEIESAYTQQGRPSATQINHKQIKKNFNSLHYPESKMHTPPAGLPWLPPMASLGSNLKPPLDTLGHNGPGLLSCHAAIRKGLFSCHVTHSGFGHC